VAESIASENLGAFASFEHKWLAAYPEQAAIGVFLAPAERLRTSAFGCLVYEFEQAAFGLREPQVVAAKLAWWRQELIGAAAGNPRHPISAVLFADARTHAVDAVAWSSLTEGAMAMLEQRSAANIDGLLDNYASLYTAVACVESTLFEGRPAQRDAVAALWTISHLLHALPTAAASGEGLRLPLDLLARHGLTRAAMTQPGAGRTAALREYLDALSERARAALAQAPDATLARRVRVRLDLAALRHAHRAADPLQWLGLHRHAGRWASLWLSWNEARRRARRSS
jgi:phytoene synthase